MTAYKLLRLRRDGTLGPLFVGRGQVIRVGEVLRARSDLPHPGLAHRPGYHCYARPEAPHLKTRLSNGERRVWCKVEIGDYTELRRPASQGGIWYLAQSMRVWYIMKEKL